MRAVHLFTDVNMSLSFDGLFAIAKQAGVDLRVLQADETCVFLNPKLTKAKTLSANGVLTYIRTNGERLSAGHLNLIPDSVKQGLKLELSKEVQKALAKILSPIPTDAKRKLSLARMAA